MPRLFVALRPPPEIRHTLRAVMTGVSAARWQSDAQLHLTLRYLGEVDAGTAQDVTTALAAVCARPITVQLAGVGAFERRGRVDTLWVGLTPHDALRRLHHAVDRALAEVVAWPAARTFVPHITVARLAHGATLADEIAQWQRFHAAVASTAFDFTHVSLYESELAPGGAEYREVSRRQLQD